MAEEEIISAVSGQVDQFQSIYQLLSSSESLQIAFTVLVVGIIGIVVVYRTFSRWVRHQKFHYVRPHLSRFVRVIVLPVFGIVLITSVNFYIQSFSLFDGNDSLVSEENSLSPSETFAKILNTINILVIGYTIAHLIPIILTKKEKSNLEKEDFEIWKELRGFLDDNGDLFHKCYKWIPPKSTPEDMTDEEFMKNMETEEGKKILEEFRTAKGLPIGSYEQLVKDPFEEWKKSERKKYLKYYDDCISGNNQSGKKLRTGQEIEEIFPIDVWREEKRFNGFDPIIAGCKPPGYAQRKRKDLPKSIS